MSRIKTGGGSPVKIILTSHEERLLSLMGKTSYQGNPKNSEKGLLKRKISIETPNVPLKVTKLIDKTSVADHTFAEFVNTIKKEIVGIPSTSHYEFPKTFQITEEVHAIDQCEPILTYNKPIKPDTPVKLPNLKMSNKENQNLNKKRNTKKSNNNSTLQEMHEEIVNELQTTNDHLATIAESLKTIADVLQKSV